MRLFFRFHFRFDDRNEDQKKNRRDHYQSPHCSVKMDPRVALFFAYGAASLFAFTRVLVFAPLFVAAQFVVLGLTQPTPTLEYWLFFEHAVLYAVWVVFKIYRAKTKKVPTNGEVRMEWGGRRALKFFNTFFHCAGETYVLQSTVNFDDQGAGIIQYVTMFAYIETVAVFVVLPPPASHVLSAACVCVFCTLFVCCVLNFGNSAAEMNSVRASDKKIKGHFMCLFFNPLVVVGLVFIAATVGFGVFDAATAGVYVAQVVGLPLVACALRVRRGTSRDTLMSGCMQALLVWVEQRLVWESAWWSGWFALRLAVAGVAQPNSPTACLVLACVALAGSAFAAAVSFPRDFLTLWRKAN